MVLRFGHIEHEGERTLARPDRPAYTSISKALIATIGAAAVAAILPIGSPIVVAAESNHESAPTLMTRACRATFSAPAFRVQGQVRRGETSEILDDYFGSAGGLFNLRYNGSQTVSVIMDGPSTYVEANATFWQAETKSRAAASVLAGRWIDMTSDKKFTAGLTKELKNKRTIVSLCNEGNGPATYSGKAAVNGVSVAKVHVDSGDGSATAYIEKGPNPYILRLVVNSPQHGSGDIVFSDYNAQPDIAAPPGAIPISQLQ